MTARTPAGLDTGGRALWRATAREHELDVVQRVLLLEACRMKDRLDRLAAGRVLTTVELPGGPTLELCAADPADLARSTATAMKSTLAALRLPEPTTGRRPQRRGGARGAYTPGGRRFWQPPTRPTIPRS